MLPCSPSFKPYDQGLVSLDGQRRGGEGRGGRGLSSGACGHYRLVSWCYLPSEISNPWLARRFQFLYMRDEDLVLLLAFTFFLCYYISACPLLYPPSYFTSVLSCACCMQPDLLPPVNSWTSQNGSVEQEIEIIWGRGRSDSNEDETTQKKPNQGKSVFGSVCWTVSGKMINHHFPPADFPPFI